MLFLVIEHSFKLRLKITTKMSCEAGVLRSGYEIYVTFHVSSPNNNHQEQHHVLSIENSYFVSAKRYFGEESSLREEIFCYGKKKSGQANNLMKNCVITFHNSRSCFCYDCLQRLNLDFLFDCSQFENSQKSLISQLYF